MDKKPCFVRRISQNEISALEGFTPEDWHFDLPEFVRFHYGQSYFYPIVADLDGKVVGCATGLLNGAVGWLGNIIVLPEYRGRGIGEAITRHLMDYFQRLGCTSQLLIATKMGEGLYRKLGFLPSANYCFYQGESEKFAVDGHIARICPEDYPRLIELDRSISGEIRTAFMSRFFESGWVYRSDDADELLGFYLPALGSGLILAKDTNAGLELLKFKLSQGTGVVTIPAENKAAARFLESLGYHCFLTVPRMVWRTELEWQPDKIFSRGAGYCG